MKTPLLAFLALFSIATAQDRSIETLRREIGQGYHRVDPRTQTQARSGNLEAQARLHYQQAQAQTNGDYNTGRITAAQAETARIRAQIAYQDELLLQIARRNAEACRQERERQFVLKVVLPPQR